MARGWESKAIEDQMDAAESARQTAAKPALTPAEMARQAQRDGLLLSRTRTMNALQSTCDARYRALLERTLAHIDEELRQLDAQAPPASPRPSSRSTTP